MSKLQNHNNRTKRIGIPYGELLNNDRRLSYVSGRFNRTMGEELRLRDEEDSSQEIRSEKTVSQYLIIDPNHICYIVWQSFHTLCCLTSSYFYVILAAFPDALESQFI